MSLMRRRIAATEFMEPSPLLDLREAAMATATESSTSNPTIAPFDHGLNGVNQTLNMTFMATLWWTLGIFGFLLFAIRVGEMAWSQLRHVSAMSAPAHKQGYWRYSQWSWMPSLKKNLIYAPLGNKRHNREIKLSGAMNIGTLPSRLHTLILVVYLASNGIYMFVLNWENENHWAFCAEVRGRSGTLAAVNMVPLVLLAARNNPLIPMLRVSFDTYNLLHRWMGRVVVFETVIHTIAWAIVSVADDGWHNTFNMKIIKESFIASGFVGTIAMVTLLILSLGPVRHAFYETFLNTHILLAMVIFICTMVHCVTAHVEGGLPQTSWVAAIFLLWFFDRVARMFRLVYNNWASRGFTEACVEAMPGDACRVTMHLPRYVDVKPGTHAYLRFREVNPWENHPFSVAWIEHHPLIRKEKQDDIITEGDIKRGTTTVSFIIGAHTGFTRALYNKASQGENATVNLRAAMEGPYAGHHQLDSYGHVVLFAGSTGITHQLSYLKPLMIGFERGTVATRRITLVWVMRDFEALEWVKLWMNEVLNFPCRKEILNIRIFITRPKNPSQIKSLSETVQMFPGRPNISTILKKEVEEQIGAMCVTVCGPGALADDVRQAVREAQDEHSVVDFAEESFTW